MKVLIITESSEKQAEYSDFFNKNGFDTINYTWLLKALDNVIEIKPDSVIVNAIDYPRHWKTLVQYIQLVHDGIKSIILIVPETIEAEEQKKIDALGVFCVTEDFVTSEGGSQILAILDAGVPQSDTDFEVLDLIEDVDRQKHVFLDISIEDYVNEFNKKIAEDAENSTSEASEQEEPSESDTFDEIPVNTVEEAHDISDNTSEEINDTDILIETSINTEQEETPINTTEEVNEPITFVDIPINSEQEEYFEDTDSTEVDVIFDDEPIEEIKQENLYIPNEPIISTSQEESIYSTDDDSIYFEETADNENIFVEDNEIEDTNTVSDIWLSCPMPETGEIINGEVRSYEHPILFFVPTDTSKISLFSFGKKIESCTLSDDGYPSVITVQVQGFEGNTIELCVVK